MRNTLQAHIKYLENRIQDLKDRLTCAGLGQDELLDLQLQLSLSESALAHYREAYALELCASSPNPSGAPEPGSEGSPNGPQDSSGPNKKTGLNTELVLRGAWAAPPKRPRKARAAIQAPRGVLPMLPGVVRARAGYRRFLPA